MFKYTHVMAVTCFDGREGASCSGEHPNVKARLIVGTFKTLGIEFLLGATPKVELLPLIRSRVQPQGRVESTWI